MVRIKLQGRRGGNGELISPDSQTLLPPDTTKWPKSIAFIMGNEACERFTLFHHHALLRCASTLSSACACAVCAHRRVPFLVGRFSFYGLKAILALYLHKYLLFSEDTSTMVRSPRACVWWRDTHQSGCGRPCRVAVRSPPTLPPPPPDHPRLHLWCLLVRLARWLHL